MRKEEANREKRLLRNGYSYPLNLIAASNIIHKIYF